LLKKSRSEVSIKCTTVVVTRPSIIFEDLT